MKETLTINSNRYHNKTPTTTNIANCQFSYYFTGEGLPSGTRWKHLGSGPDHLQTLSGTSWNHSRSPLDHINYEPDTLWNINSTQVWLYEKKQTYWTARTDTKLWNCKNVLRSLRSPWNNYSAHCKKWSRTSTMNVKSVKIYKWGWKWLTETLYIHMFIKASVFTLSYGSKHIMTFLTITFRLSRSSNVRLLFVFPLWVACSVSRLPSTPTRFGRFIQLTVKTFRGSDLLFCVCEYWFLPALSPLT